MIWQVRTLSSLTIRLDPEILRHPELMIQQNHFGSQTDGGLVREGRDYRLSPRASLADNTDNLRSIIYRRICKESRQREPARRAYEETSRVHNKIKKFKYLKICATKSNFLLKIKFLKHTAGRALEACQAVWELLLDYKERATNEPGFRAGKFQLGTQTGPEIQTA